VLAIVPFAVEALKSCLDGFLNSVFCDEEMRCNVMAVAIMGQPLGVLVVKID
jgi:hypothetical protein